MIDTLFNIIAITLSLGAIYLTSCGKELWLRRAGCCLGILACFTNLALQVGNAPWSTWLLSIACLFIYAKGADLLGLAKKLWSRK